MSEPRIRFSRKDGIPYPELHHATMGDYYIERDEHGSEGLPMLTVSIHSGVSDGQLDEEELGKRVKRSAVPTMYKKAIAGDLVFNMMRAWQGAVGCVKTTGMVSPAYIVAVPKEDIDPSYMNYYVQTKIIIDRFNRLSYGALDFRKRLYWDSFIATEVNIPDIEEQQKIADFLSSVDEVIAASEAEVQNLETQKKAVMKKIFSQEVRFKREDGTDFPEWEEKCLDEVVEFLDGMRKPIETGNRVAGPYPYYGASGITDYVEDYIFDEDLILLSEDGANILDRNYRVCFMARGKYWVNNHAHVLRANNDCVNEYVCEYLESLDYSRMNSGSAQPKLNQQTCRRIPVKKPCLEEQRLIADFLFNFDEAIAAAKKELELWKELKKGLLQQMFV